MIETRETQGPRPGAFRVSRAHTLDSFFDRDWETAFQQTFTGLLHTVDELAAEAGAPVDEVRRDLEEEAATAATMLRRVFVVAVAR